MTAGKRPRLVAFYLTQFHPIPENDEWWGKGFTEWTNVTKAAPLFDGHYQPHLPTDFGFYDLRVRATRHDQMRVAREHGIDAFCYHYYWFSGKRLLEQPLLDMLADPASDMPFCLCWANENWTRRWDAAEHKVLIAQRYAPEDDLEFIKAIAPFLKDPRYVCVDGAPLLIVYRPQHLPDARRSGDVWREYCRSIGIERVHLCAALTHNNRDYQRFGFDSGVEFPPHNLTCPSLASQVAFRQPFRGTVLDYGTIAGEYLARRYDGQNVFRSVFPSWDNTARSGERALIVLGGNPGNYEQWLDGAVRATQEDHPDGDRLVFINAWNEWAEGCHLEPDRRHGRAFLEATRRVARGEPLTAEFTTAPDAAAAERRLLADLRWVAAYHWAVLVRQAVTWLKRHPRLRRLVRAALGKAD